MIITKYTSSSSIKLIHFVEFLFCGLDCSKGAVFLLSILLKLKWLTCIAYIPISVVNVTKAEMM